MFVQLCVSAVAINHSRYTADIQQAHTRHAVDTGKHDRHSRKHTKHTDTLALVSQLVVCARNSTCNYIAPNDECRNAAVNLFDDTVWSDLVCVLLAFIWA